MQTPPWFAARVGRRSVLLVVAVSTLLVAAPVSPSRASDDPSPIQAGAAATVQARRLAMSGPTPPLSSPDVGEHCAAGFDADDLTAFFSEWIGPVGGVDYQRALLLDDDRVLWAFQDAFVDGELIHNLGIIQSGRCFTILDHTGGSWLLADRTVFLERWHWILDGTQEPDGSIHLFVAEFEERGDRYLEHSVPTTVNRVVLDPATLAVTGVVAEPPADEMLYGWSVTSDTTHTYLFGHCFRQFGFDGLFGFDDCAEYVTVARTPIGQLTGPREYWNGTGWVGDPLAASPVVDGWFVTAGNNPAQIEYVDGQFVLVEKRDDWWGTTVEFGMSANAHGPFVNVASVPEPLKCARATCNTYFTSWIPWRDSNGELIWSISHNLWDGYETSGNLDVYGPTFHAIAF